MQSIDSLYIHFPYCRHLCNYCDFYKHKIESGSNQLENFEKLLLESMVESQNFLDENGFDLGVIENSLHGWGTPSLWGKRGAEFLKQHIVNSGIEEFTLEVDPMMWDEEGLSAFEDIGVNRFSIGLQSFDENYLKILDRAHTKEDGVVLFDRLKGKNYSVDFLIGAPTLGKRDIIEELKQVIDYGPSHFSVYILNTSELITRIEIKCQMTLTKEMNI